MYKVVKSFTDLQDDKYPYAAGDIFPRSGLEVSQERIKELASASNKRKTPLIELVEEDFMNPPETPTVCQIIRFGGWFLCRNCVVLPTEVASLQIR